MYTRSYFTEDKKVEIPENYDGTAFREKDEEAEAIEELPPPPFLAGEESEKEETEAEEAFSRKSGASLFDKLPIKNLSERFPFSLFKSGSHGEKGPVFGTEEILICIVALYMFFSKDGDKECAIMLAILLFIH